MDNMAQLADVRAAQVEIDMPKLSYQSIKKALAPLIDRVVK